MIAFILELILFILGFIFVVIIVIVSIMLSKDIKKIDVTPNQPLLEIKRKTIKGVVEGYTFGIIKTQRQNKNGTHFIEFYPWDVEQGDIAPRPEIKSFVCADYLMKRSVKGDASDRREIITIIPRHKIESPEYMQGTYTEDWMTKEGQLGFIKSIIGEAITGGDEAIAEAMKHFSRGNIAKQVIAIMQENSMLTKLPEHQEIK